MTLTELYNIILDRQENPVEGSYTNYLFKKGQDEILKKIGEESVEVILAAKSQGKERLIEEVADLTYHTLVLLADSGLTPADILTELDKRHRPQE
jgi:phosphoribosyl-ATP pyrophosphohydrolase